MVTSRLHCKVVYHRRSHSRIGGVCIFDLSQYFRFEPEQEPKSTSRFCVGANQICKGSFEISVTQLVVVKQNGIHQDLFSGQRRHISLQCDNGLESLLSSRCNLNMKHF